MAKHRKIVIFDFGNVLINLDFDRCFKQFEEILEVDWSDRKLPISIVHAIQKYDRGHISDEALIWAFQNQNPSADPRLIKKAWNSLIGEIPQERFEMLKMLRKDFDIALLSNINRMHELHINKYLIKQLGIEDFESQYFDHIFYSHKLGMRKPDRDLYEYVVDQTKHAPEDILFIDDMKVNIETAKEHKWNAIQHNPKTEISEKIESYLREIRFA